MNVRKNAFLIILSALTAVSGLIFIITIVCVAREMDAKKVTESTNAVSLIQENLHDDIKGTKNIDANQDECSSRQRMQDAGESIVEENPTTPAPTLYEIPFGNFHEEHLYRLDPTELSDYLYVRKEFLDFYQSYQSSYKKDPNIWNDAINGFQLDLAQRLGEEGMNKISN